MLFLVIGLFELLVMKSTGYGIEKQQRERYNRDPLKDLVSIYLVFSYYNSRESLRWHRCQWCFWWQENRKQTNNGDVSKGPSSPNLVCITSRSIEGFKVAAVAKDRQGTLFYTVHPRYRTYRYYELCLYQRSGLFLLISLISASSKRSANAM